MNKNGFTLIELLAVIAIIAILVTIAIPKVLEYYNKSKKELFLVEVGKLYSETKKEIDSSVLSNRTFNGANSKKGPKLNLMTNSLEYCIEVKDNVITSVKAYNDEYYIETNASYNTFKKDVSINDIKEHNNDYTCD